MSTNTVGRRTDLQPITAGMNPLEFQVHSCELCGFTGGAFDFSGAVEPEVSSKIEAVVKPHLGDQVLDAGTRWEFASRIAEWRGQPADHIAQLYINAATCAYEADKERYYRLKAADWLEQALESGPMTSDERPITLYLVGELYRRAGEPGVAAGWFDRSIEEVGSHPDAERIRELALQQKTDPKEEL